MREPSGPGVNFSTIIGELDQADRFDLCAIMTLLLMLLYGGNALRLRVPITILVIAALIFAGLRRRPAFWLVLTLSYVLGNAPDWLRLDNHKYLMGYWSLAFCFACLSERPMKTLAFNARVMIGLCFVLAVVWKLSTPDFVDGTFFQFTFFDQGTNFQIVRPVRGKF